VRSTGTGQSRPVTSSRARGVSEGSAGEIVRVSSLLTVSTLFAAGLVIAGIVRPSATAA
jgi:hypothetical protein